MGYQNYVPLLVIEYDTAPNIHGYQNGTLILGTTRIASSTSPNLVGTGFRGGSPGRSTLSESQCTGNLRWNPHPGIVTMKDNKDYVRVLSYPYYTTVTGWGVHLLSKNVRICFPILAFLQMLFCFPCWVLVNSDDPDMMQQGCQKVVFRVDVQNPSISRQLSPTPLRRKHRVLLYLQEKTHQLFFLLRPIRGSKK